MTKTEIQNAITTTPARYAFEVRTAPALTKKNRTTKAPTTFTVEKRSTFTAVAGACYQDEVNKVRESQGLAKDFVAAPPSGKHYVDGSSWLMEADRTPGKFYAALSAFEDQHTEYYIDGVLATAEQVEDLKTNYLPKASPVTTPVTWRTYGIDGITKVEAVA